MDATHTSSKASILVNLYAKLRDMQVPASYHSNWMDYAATRLLQFTVDGYTTICYANLMQKDEHPRYNHIPPVVHI